MTALRAAWLLIALAAARGQAAEIHAWHSFDTHFQVLPKKLELVLHHRTRTRQELTFPNQVRAGSVLQWHATVRLTPNAGYYFLPERVPGDWVYGHRVFLGMEARFLPDPEVELTTNLAAERHIGTERRDYNRYRSSIRFLFGRAAVAPFIRNQMLAVNQGFHSMRNSGGLRVVVSPKVAFEVGYLYDVRRTVWGGDRQAIVTEISFQPGGR